MITSGLCVFIFTILIGLILIFLSKLWTIELAYIRLCWVPLLLLSFIYAFRFPLTSKLSYAMLILPILIAFGSLILGIIGIVLIVSARQRLETRRGLIPATIIASVPGLLLFVLFIATFMCH